MTISMMAPDSAVKLAVLRNGSERNLTVKLGELPTTEASIEHEGNGGSSSALSGVSVEDLNAQYAKELGLPASAQGVVVTQVGPSSAASEAGLRRGDVIQEVNRKPVKNTSDFEHAVAGSKEDTLLLVNRHGSTIYLTV
jgi:serine protease Do